MDAKWVQGRNERQRMHEDDLKAIIQGISGAVSEHACRFSTIKPDDMEAIVPFMLKFKSLSEKIGSVILIVIVTAFTGGLIAIFSRGFWRN
jgi:hypothetical protein